MKSTMLNEVKFKYSNMQLSKQLLQILCANKEVLSTREKIVLEAAATRLEVVEEPSINEILEGSKRNDDWISKMF